MKKMYGIIVQARMNSSRFYGKVIKKIEGRTSLSYLFERLKTVESTPRIILATTVNKLDNIIVKEAQRHQITCFRGSENNVLDRYYQAAVKFNIDPIIRITADCPLILPDLIDKSYRSFLKKKPDYLGYLLPYPEGLADISVISFSALKIAWQQARKPSEKEHVVTFLLNRPNRFRLVHLKVKSDINHLRFTVDEKCDFPVVKHIIKSLYGKPKRIFGLEEIEDFACKHPEITNINIHVPRNEGYKKSLMEDKKWERENVVRTK